MTAQLTETLMGLGELNLELDYDADVLAELVEGATLVLWHGEERIFAADLLWDTPARSGILIGGRGLDFRLGQDGDGVIILDREYLAGTNKLSNPGFELDDLYWRTGEGTNWRFVSTSGQPHAGDWAAVVVGNGTKDDVLATTEAWYAPPGSRFRAVVWARRPSGATGHLRLRPVFEGRFDPPQMLTNGGFADGTGWTNVSDVAGDAAIVSGHLRLGPTTALQHIVNPSFEDDLTHWSADGADWGIVSGLTVSGETQVRTGTKAVELGNAGPFTGRRVLQYDADLVAALVNPITPVKAGDRYRFEGFVKDLADAVDELPAAGVVYFVVLQTNVNDPNERVYLESVHFDANNPASDWRSAPIEFDVGEGKTHLVPMIFGFDVAAGSWVFDDITLTRLKGNTAVFAHDPFTVTPERTYRLLAQVTADAAMVAGTFKAVVVFSGAGRDDITVESSSLERGDATRQLLSWDFTPQSGYDTAALSLMATDVAGGSFVIDNASVVDTDRSTLVNDEVIGPTQAGWARFEIITDPAPEGTDQVRLEVVAEADADGWVVDDVELARVVDAPATVDDVVLSLLVDDDGDPLLEPGEIFGSDTLLYDLRILRQDKRTVLKHVCRSGVVSPLREFRVNADGSIDVGTAEEIFTDQADAILAIGDLELLDEPTVERNREDKVTDVLVIGAERQLADGRRVVVIGEAHDPPGGRRRTRVIEDSTVDHKGYADALAEWHLAQSKATAEVVQVRLADWRASFDFGVGDWIYPWLPEAGLEDEDRPTPHNGRTAYPKRVRVLARDWHLGAGPFRVELISPSGTTFDITRWVRWENETTADLTVGDVMPEFLVDPQGGAAGNQFLRYRASR